MSANLQHNALLFLVCLLFTSCVKDVDFEEAEEITITPIIEANLVFFDIEATRFYDVETDMPILSVSDVTELPFLDDTGTQENLLEAEFTFLFANSIEREFVVDFEFLDDDGVIQYNTQTTVNQGFSGDVRETEFIHSVVVPETLNLTMANRLRIVVTIPSSDATLQGNLVMQSKATFYFEIKDRD